MINIWKRMTLVLGIMMVLSACTGQQQGAEGENQPEETNIKDVSDHTEQESKLNDPSIIPSETGDKTRTTSEHGTTYKGIGQNIYSSIGSSGIHEGGVSSYFESILEGEGITGVKVFVVDDSVVLAREKQQTTSHKYDEMQSNVLSQSDGMSGKGEPEGVEGSQNESHDNLNQAKEMVTEMFNGNVKILTVTDPKAVDLINSIKENIMSSSYQEASSDLLTLLKMSK